jgi:general secretion pathway protein K
MTSHNVRCSARERRHAEAGSALLVVLVLLGSIAALVAIVSRSISGAALEMSVARASAEHEWDLRAGIELGVAAIARLGENMRSAEASASLPDRRIRVRVTNERARIDLNAADAAQLVALLKASGLSDSDASVLARNLIEWRGGTQQFSASIEDRRQSTFIGMGGSDLRPDSELRKAPQQIIGTRFFLHPLQLTSVPGFSAQLVARLLPLVTVANGSNQVDPYLASSETLLAMPGVSPATVDAFLAARDGNSGRELAIKLLGMPENMASSRAAAGWRIEIRSLGSNGQVYLGEAVVAILESDSEPYRVLYVSDAR